MFLQCGTGAGDYSGALDMYIELVAELPGTGNWQIDEGLESWGVIECHGHWQVRLDGGSIKTWNSFTGSEGVESFVNVFAFRLHSFAW